MEVIHGMTESGPSACERCGGPLRRRLYPTGIIFKGSGFYKTDSRREPSTGTPSAAADAASKAPSAEKPAESSPSSGATTPAPAAGSDKR
jgi:predicted nucleic acid-binding Zn ribbon protein